MTAKVLDIKNYLHLVCIRNDKDICNPYKLYLVYNARHEQYGYYTERRKQIAKYGNMASVLCMITDMYNYNVQYKPIDEVISWCKSYYGS